MNRCDRCWKPIDPKLLLTLYGKNYCGGHCVSIVYAKGA